MNPAFRDSQTLGEALRNMRQARGMNQTELANATGIRRSNLSSYERGVTRPNLETMDLILGALQADLTDLANALQLVPIHRRVLTGEARPADIENAAFLNAETAIREWLQTLRARALVETTNERP